MSLQLVLGASKTGKTNYIYETMIQDSMKKPEEKFFFVVPDQSTLNAQRQLVTRHPNHGTMNIDVVGFFRLAYRVFEELSFLPKEILEDEGKAMVLRKIMDRNKTKLEVFASSIGKQGFIDEVKSFFSEMCQYDIEAKDLEELLDSMKEEDSLSLKIKDVLLVFEQFQEELKDKYMMSEQLLDVLADKIKESRLLQDATFYFDGFTGFSPIQLKVIRQLLLCGKKVVITFTVDTKAISKKFRPFELFAMPKKEIYQLRQLASEIGVKIESDILFEKEERKSKELFHLERNLFRYPFQVYENETKDLMICQALNQKEECQYVANQIETLVREHEYRYEDILVFVGDMEAYYGQLEQSFQALSIPYFMDGTKKLKNNPCVETILSVLKMLQTDFSYDMVFRYLKSGFTQMNPNEVDKLENFVLEQGIEGYHRWNRPFVSRRHKEDELEQLNVYRVKFINEIQELKDGLRKRGATILERVTALYQFLVRLRIQEQLEEKAETFEAIGELVLAKTYEQIYGQIIALFDRMVDILGDEVMSYETFCGVLESGLEEIKVGVIPPSLDQVMVGDMERTRAEDVKALFFLGMNEGIVPKPAKKNGILTDSQKERLESLGITMSPTMTSTTYIEQYYLYLAVTKPEQKLYLSYPAMNPLGESLLPSYFIDKMQKLFPNIKRVHAAKELKEAKIYTKDEALQVLIDEMQQIEDNGPSDKLQYLYQALEQASRMQSYIDAYFYQNEEEALDKKIVSMLYGEELNNSVTRLEKFSSCAFAHFLQYGLKLKERLVHKILPTDLGSIFHETMELVGKKTTWKWESDQARDEFVEQVVNEAIEKEDASILEESSRNQYTIERIKRMAKRAVWAVEQQVKRGEFTPKEYEYAFSSKDGLESTNIQLEDGTMMRFRGVVDRMDVLEEDEHIFLKIVDYKSGNTKFDYTTLFHGISMQLIVYMNAMLELTQKKYPKKEVIPAGMFYFHIDDPIIAPKSDEVDIEVLKNLKLSGVANEDYLLLKKLEKPDYHGVLTIPYGRKSNGELTKNSSVLDSNHMKKMGQFVNGKIRSIGNEMMQGKIQIQPYEYIYSSCDYCPYHSVCAFDSKVNEKRVLKKIKQEEAVILLEGKEASNAVDKTTTRSN